MPALVVGGVTIPIAVSSPSFSRSDAADRGRMFDNTYYASQTGGAAREWDFSTPPVSTTDAATYSAVIGKVAAQLCSGDILELPTMCCAEYTGGTPVRTAVGHRVVLNFRLHEVQSASVLLKYTPGSTVTGESFTRSTVGYSINAAGTLVSNAINAKRDSHYVGGVRSILLEDTRTSGLLWASDFSNAAWAKGSMSIGTGIADPTGGTGACTLTATGAVGFVEQALAAGSSIVRTNTVWLRRRTGTGVIQVAAPSTGYTTVTLTASWQRFTLVGSAATNRYGGIHINTSGDAIDAFMFDQEDAGFASSEIPTTTVALARSSDFYSLPFTAPPQESSMYAKFIELGTLAAPGRIAEITSAGGADPRFILYSTGSVYQVYHGNSGGAVTSTLAAVPVRGDVVELLARLYGDGSVDITQSINGAASTSGTQSAANPLATAWGGPLVWLNSEGTIGSVGFMALQSFKIIAGARTLVEMRAL